MKDKDQKYFNSGENCGLSLKKKRKKKSRVLQSESLHYSAIRLTLAGNSPLVGQSGLGHPFLN